MAGDWFDGNGTSGAVDVAGMMDGQPAQGLREIVEHGALVSVGLTSDGGALHVTVTMDGRFRREYFRERDTLLAWLGEAILAVADGEARPTTAPRSRSRRRAAA